MYLNIPIYLTLYVYRLQINWEIYKKNLTRCKKKKKENRKNSGRQSSQDSNQLPPAHSYRHISLLSGITQQQ
jgi:hypothetical protein